MKLIFGKLALGAAVVAAAAFVTPGSSTLVSAASAAPLGPQTGLTDDSSAVTQVKDWHHRHRGRYLALGVGGLIVAGAGYCTVEANRCADIFGGNRYGYRRCMYRAGCY